MPVRTGGTAPYAPSATVLQAINAFRDRGLTTPITEEVLIRASIPESLAARTVRSLEGLDLINPKDGMPTPELEGLRRVSSAEFKPRLEAIIRAVYAEVFKFTDPATDDADKVADAFRAFEPIGQRTRMVTLFLGLCAAAGIIPEPEKKAKASAATTARPGLSRLQKPVGNRGPSTGGPAGMRVQHGGGRHELVGTNGVIPPAIMGLVADIPVRGWTEAKRKEFITTFEAVLKYAIPTLPEGTTATGPEDANDDIDE